MCQAFGTGDPGCTNAHVRLLEKCPSINEKPPRETRREGHFLPVDERSLELGGSAAVKHGTDEGSDAVQNDPVDRAEAMAEAAKQTLKHPRSVARRSRRVVARGE